MNNLIISRPELQQITGYAKPSFQIKWLTKNGIVCRRAADGYPIVSRRAFEHAMGANDPAENEPKLSLNFLDNPA